MQTAHERSGTMSTIRFEPSESHYVCEPSESGGGGPAAAVGIAFIFATWSCRETVPFYVLPFASTATAHRQAGQRRVMYGEGIVWGRGAGEGIGLSGHKNEYKSGVRIGNWVEELFGREAPMTADSLKVRAPAAARGTPPRRPSCEPTSACCRPRARRRTS